jgi:hypothetical protein
MYGKYEKKNGAILAFRSVQSIPINSQYRLVVFNFSAIPIPIFALFSMFDWVEW